jgi:hypothetical protein
MIFISDKFFLFSPQKLRILVKTVKYFLIIATFLLKSVFSLSAQNTAGREFWLTFGNIDVANPLSTLHNIRIVNGSQTTAG